MLAGRADCRCREAGKKVVLADMTLPLNLKDPRADLHEGEQVLEVVEAHPGELGQQASARRSNHGTDRYQPSSGEEGLGETSRSTTNEWEDEQKELKLSLNDPRDLKSLIIGLRTMLSGLRITRERVRMPWVDRAEISAANWCSI